MTAYENTRAAMIAGVYGTITSEEVQPLLADVAPIQTCIKDLGAHLENLDRIVAVQSDKPGFAQKKEQKVAELAQLAAEVCGSTVAYAEPSGDERLAAKLNIPFTKLSTGKSSRIISNCRNIRKAASSVVDSLGEFKVTAAKLKSLKQKTDDYKSLSTKPREAAAERKAATKIIEHSGGAAAGDSSVGQAAGAIAGAFQGEQPGILRACQAARRIVKPGSADGAKARAEQKTTNLSRPAPVAKAA